MQRYGRHLYEPVWRAQRLHRNRIPAALRRWLFDESSLTLRLQAACGEGFRVRLLGQAWRRPMTNEALALGLRRGQRCLVRQVHLLCDETPWVFARTVIPLRTLKGRRRRLARLGNRPLGATLFSDPTMRRDSVEVARIRPGQRPFALAMGEGGDTPDAIWGRRSVFYLDGKPLLVSEFFLPQLPTGCLKAEP